MPDVKFIHPRLAAVYDVFDGDRNDLDPYLAMTAEFEARDVLDLGCGTGVLALLLVDRGLAVTGVDPAAGMLDAARAKPGAAEVSWIDGDARVLPVDAVDLAVMTGNAAQAVVEDTDWNVMLERVYTALRPGGRFVFETRDPARRDWEHWPGEAVIDVPGDRITSRCELVSVDLPLITFRDTNHFASDDAVIVSESTLRFRDRDELATDLERHGFVLDEIRDAPDRPGLEFVVVARRP